MKKMILALMLMAGALVAPSPASAQDSASVVFDATKPPARYSASEEKRRTLKGVMASKGNISDGKSAAKANAKLLAGPYFFYAGASQYLAVGESANYYAVNLHVELPYMDTTNDSHTLGENAVQSRDQQQTVEIGWTHDPIVCGVGNSPCLFSGSWKNHVFLGYGTGFVDYAPTTVDVGDILPTGTPKRFLWQYSGGVWWAAYDGQWVGYYPGTIWTNAPNSVTFDKGGVFQGFYEVATKPSGDAFPCTDMGNGKLGSDVSGTSARSGTNALGGTLPGAIANNFSGFSFGGGVYDHNTVSVQTTRAGGFGYNAAGTGTGTLGSC